MREIIFDVETTGLDAKGGDRIIEIGGLELIDKKLTGKEYHYFLNPENKKISPEAQAVHGISNEDVKDKPTFAELLPQFLEFFSNAKLVAHNASFDIEFLNAELKNCGETIIDIKDKQRVCDTLEMARQKYPGERHTLDALCKKFNISTAKRTLHGALLDSELLTEVYLELTGHRNIGLALDNQLDSENENVDENNRQMTNQQQSVNKNYIAKTRPKTLPPRISEAEKQAHQKFIKMLGDNSNW